MGPKGHNNPKIIVVLGPTASGKSDLAVEIALKIKNVGGQPSYIFYGGEIVSADSRQVYKGMDIGTGKITSKEMRGVPHHLLSVASPKRRFTVAQYKQRAERAIKKILNKNKIPIICGGSAFYIKVLVDGISIPEVSPDWKIRKKLQKKNAENLYQELKKKDPRRAKEIGENNKRRLIRALEIIEKTKKPVPPPVMKGNYTPLFIGIKKPREKLDKRIKRRMLKRLQEGMVEETKALRKSGISWKRLESFGLEYKWTALYLQNKISYTKMTEELFKDIKRFSKVQERWWRKDKRIHWVKDKKEAERLVQEFLYTAD